MKDRSVRNRIVWGLTVVLAVCLAGCNLYGTDQQDEERKEPQQEQALREEPRISLYIVDTKETKTLPVEEYLLGVVAGEMEPNWPKQAYAAQAILARSFTMQWLDSGKKSRYGTDLSTDVEEAQAYDPAGISDTIREAVDDTRGEVIVYNGDYVKGWFHSYSGGQTAGVKEGLNYQGEEPAYVKNVKLPDNPYVPDELKDWEATFSASEVQEALTRLGANIGSLESVSIGDRGPSGRATSLVFVGSEGQKEVSAPEFRIAIGPVKLKSTLLKDIDVQNGQLTARGSGFGHGVGLSQWDVYMFAKDGESAEDIARRFFEGIEIKRIW